MSRPAGRSALLVLLGCLLVCGGLSCSRQTASSGERVFTVRGVVRGPYHDGTVSIQHEAIPGYMPAMTMPFKVDAAEARTLAPGDFVVFDFIVGETSRAANFRRVGRAPAVTEQAPAAPPPAARRRVREGEAVPEFTLVDQQNRAFTAADLRGRMTVLTFVFTRCPVPEFCPLMARKFQTLQTELAARAGLPASDVQLLSISIDPEHDRPEVLRAYGESLGADFRRWRFATGSGEEIARLTRAFAVHTERNGGSLDHTLTTALVGGDGRVIEIWRGNAWKPEDVLARITGEAAR